MDGASVSAGICAHNEEETIGQLLEDVMGSDIAFEQVIVVVAGDDKTADIVREKADRYGPVVLVEEGERRGQTAAQNEILERVTADLLFLIDGDGTIREGSLERMLDAYDGEDILSANTVPVMDDRWLRPVVETLWDIHHEACLAVPKFSTQLGLIPADLLDRIPPDTTLDDEYIMVRAREAGYGIRYLPDAVKEQHLPESFRFYLHQRRKNWAGRMQLRGQGLELAQDEALLLPLFLRQYRTTSLRRMAALTALGIIEAVQYLRARVDTVRGEYHQIWYRV